MVDEINKAQAGQLEDIKDKLKALELRVNKSSLEISALNNAYMMQSMSIDGMLATIKVIIDTLDGIADRLPPRESE